MQSTAVYCKLGERGKGAKKRRVRQPAARADKGVFEVLAKQGSILPSEMGFAGAAAALAARRPLPPQPTRLACYKKNLGGALLPGRCGQGRGSARTGHAGLPACMWACWVRSAATYHGRGSSTELQRPVLWKKIVSASSLSHTLPQQVAECLGVYMAHATHCHGRAPVTPVRQSHSGAQAIAEHKT